LSDIDVKVNATDKWKCTALHSAAEGGYLPIVKQLLCADGVKVDLREQFNRTPLCQASSKGHREVLLRLLLEEDVNVNVGGWGGSTPLHYATKKGDLPLTELLLERPELDPNKPDRCGRTALWLAAEAGNVAMIAAFLRDSRVKVVNDRCGKGPMRIARIRGHADAVRLLQSRTPLSPPLLFTVLVLVICV
jgi:ankyrin repeat protein